MTKEMIGGLSSEEKSELEGLLNASSAHRSYAEFFRNPRWQISFQRGIEFSKENKQRAKAKIDQVLFPDIVQKGKLRTFYRSWWLRASVAAVLTIGIGGYWLHKRVSEENSPRILGFSDLTPGGNKATLTLEDGSVVDLDSSQSRVIRYKNGVEVKEKPGGEIVYTLTHNNRSAGEKELRYNKIVTPTGGQFKVALPDGSKVWLNASSSLRFPASFSDTARVVQLEGEAYFEIAKDASRPFRVSVKGVGVDVLGTKFDIMAYEGEPAINATLLDGAISIKTGSISRTMRPGQKASIPEGRNDTIAVNDDPHASDNIAWVYGIFQFRANDIEFIMRQLGRWYNFDVVFTKPIIEDGMIYTAQLNRGNTAAQILDVIQASGRVTFQVMELNGRKRVLVTPLN